MKFHNEVLTKEKMPNECIIIFTQSNCDACSKLIDKIRDIDFEFHILNEVSGSELGPLFTIFSAPTAIVIKGGEEITRFYGNKSSEYIEKIITDNF